VFKVPPCIVPHMRFFLGISHLFGYLNAANFVCSCEEIFRTFAYVVAEHISIQLRQKQLPVQPILLIPATSNPSDPACVNNPISVNLKEVGELEESVLQ